ncbi:hypothetical protein EJ08DRAFT_692437 [Tothia fuscella]|uniref:Uncharacterized protein n=1 Tax=Tothia fuscella TaxID=1048955 RepID=A0A9P4U4D1_9PEZI|nr:hypothetical protein EJ08DRAFT_692437 [Tothia fuscella]
MSKAPIHSTGRGGQGNIGPDTTQYTDGTIHREGIQGQSVDGDYSSGRGGAGNIVHSPQVKPERRGSQDIIPEANLIPGEGHENFHTGRGGGGNVHKEKYGGHSHDPSKPKESVIDKAKAKVEGLLQKKPKDGTHPPPAA